MKFTILKKSQNCLLVFLMTALCLCGCSYAGIDDDESVLSQGQEGQAVSGELYVMETLKPGKYEPSEGIYTGAYVEDDEKVSKDLVQYEALIGQKQTFRVFNYRQSRGLDRQEILKCIAQQKTPYIKLLLGTDYDITDLYQLIFDIRSSYRTPVFIELYPLTEKQYTPKAYKELFQRGYEIIHRYLDDAVIVWSCDDTRIEDMKLFYPGDRYVDWVGLNVYIPRYKYHEAYVYTGLNKLDYWYKSFQHRKPLMISGLAVSHFSRVDHAYTVQDTIDKLKLFYHDVLSACPRIRGIIYMDVDMAAVTTRGKENYTLTEHQQLIEAMQQLSLPLKINAQLKKNQDDLGCYQKYSIQAMYFEDELYIPQEYMSACFGKVPVRKLRHKEDLSGEIYYAYSDISAYCNTWFKS